MSTEINSGAQNEILSEEKKFPSSQGENGVFMGDSSSFIHEGKKYSFLNKTLVMNTPF